MLCALWRKLQSMNGGIGVFVCVCVLFYLLRLIGHMKKELNMLEIELKTNNKYTYTDRHHSDLNTHTLQSRFQPS